MVVDVPQGGVQFCQAATPMPGAVTAITEQFRGRVAHWFARCGRLDPDDARDRRTWE